jgi:hypothetical protein
VDTEQKELQGYSLKKLSFGQDRTLKSVPMTPHPTNVAPIDSPRIATETIDAGKLRTARLSEVCPIRWGTKPSSAISGIKQEVFTN